MRDEKEMDKSTRSELKRSYTETSRPAGVYCITNTATGRRLIGTSVDVTSIMNRHRAELSFGHHRCADLLADWKEYGPELFTFETLDLLDEQDDNHDNLQADLETLEQLCRERIAASGENEYHM